MNDLENIKISFAAVSDNNLISLLLYGNDKRDDTKNRKILMSTIRFIEDSQRFNEQFFYNLPASYPYAVIFICCFAEGFLLPSQKCTYLKVLLDISHNTTMPVQLSKFKLCFMLAKLNLICPLRRNVLDTFTSSFGVFLIQQ